MMPQWTPEQATIVGALENARCLIEAGPGTGKTATACGRVAHLLAADLPLSSILMLSFTRTAVSEMRERIRGWSDAGRVSGVNILTLDQAAFSFGTGTGGKFVDLTRSYNGGIGKVVAQLRAGNPVMREFLERLGHVIIDEAQDLFGERAELACLLLGLLPPAAGATVFADPAQAIYEFTNDSDARAQRSKSFLQIFDPEKQFQRASLTKIYRTGSPPLLKLFTEARATLHAPECGEINRVQAVIDVATGTGPAIDDRAADSTLRDCDLILYRKRASALMGATFSDRLFRLRLPGLPAPVFPWIGLVFSTFLETTISKEDFAARWAECVGPGLDDGFDGERAWNLLFRFAGKGREVQLDRLRSVLSRPRPPVEFCHRDYGNIGPIFSTIHASKGREADSVCLMLPRNLRYLDEADSGSLMEEARVYYVGMTRARKSFRHSVSQTMAGTEKLEKTERTVQARPEEKFKFQVGLAGDLDDAAAISRDPFLCASDSEASQRQAELVAMWRNLATTQARARINVELVRDDTGDKWVYRFVHGDRTLAWSAPQLGRALQEFKRLIEKKCGGPRKVPARLNHLHVLGLRTCVLGDDAALAGQLREPFATSGLWLAPSIFGFPTVHCPKK